MISIARSSNFVALLSASVALSSTLVALQFISAGDPRSEHDSSDDHPMLRREVPVQVSRQVRVLSLPHDDGDDVDGSAPLPVVTSSPGDLGDAPVNVTIYMNKFQSSQNA